MLNESFFEILINVFMKNYKFVLWKIIDGSRWGLHTLFQLCNHMVNAMVKCQHSYFQTHPCSLYIKKGSHVVVDWHLLWEVHKSRMHPLSLQHVWMPLVHKQWFGKLGFLCTNKVFEIWFMFNLTQIFFEHLTYKFMCFTNHACDNGLTIQRFLLGCFKMETFCMLIHMWIMLNELK
jgi:hypothetical protein